MITFTRCNQDMHWLSREINMMQPAMNIHEKVIGHQIISLIGCVTIAFITHEQAN